MKAIQNVAPQIGVRPACEALTINRASYYRWKSPESAPGAEGAKVHPRALSEPEQARALAFLNSPRFVDRSPEEVYYTLLDEGIYIGSVRTFYRLLAEAAAAGRVLERRNQLRHPAYVKPELLATGRNQVWSWDITKLRAPVKWSYFYLYVIMDIFSRYVVGWMVALSETAVLARQLIQETSQKQGITPQITPSLALHSDRGAPMRSQTVSMLLAQLGITASFSRPHTSDDNPYSEAAFKTLKYWPGFPGRFGSQEDAQESCRQFFLWYNQQHRHSGIGYMTPEAVHYGSAGKIREVRNGVLQAAYQAHPERFVGGKPAAPVLPDSAWINRPTNKTEEAGALEKTDGKMMLAPAEDTATQKCDRSAAGAPHGGLESEPRQDEIPPVGESGKLRGSGGRAPSGPEPKPPAQPSDSLEVLQ